MNLQKPGARLQKAGLFFFVRALCRKKYSACERRARPLSDSPRCQHMRRAKDRISNNRNRIRPAPSRPDSLMQATNCQMAVPLPIPARARWKKLHDLGQPHDPRSHKMEHRASASTAIGSSLPCQSGSLPDGAFPNSTALNSLSVPKLEYSNAVPCVAMTGIGIGAHRGHDGGEPRGPLPSSRGNSGRMRRRPEKRSGPVEGG